MNIDSNKINAIVTRCKLSGEINNDLGKIMLQVVEGVYRQCWPKSSHSTMLKDEIKDYALLRLIQNWQYWDKGNALGFFNYCVKRYMKYYLMKYAEVEAESLINEEGDTIEIGVWDDSFDRIKMNGELAYEAKLEAEMIRNETKQERRRRLAKLNYARKNQNTLLKL